MILKQPRGLVELCVAPLRLNRTARVRIIPAIVFCVFAGLGPFLDSSTYSTPQFDAVLDIFPLTVWGIAFILCGVALSTAVANGRWIPYFIGRIFLFGFSVAWLTSLVLGRLSGSTRLTPTTIGVWLYVVFIQLIEMVVPRKWHHGGS